MYSYVDITLNNLNFITMSEGADEGQLSIHQKSMFLHSPALAWFSSATPTLGVGNFGVY